MLLRLDGNGPRYGQITRALRAAIQDGALTPGSRVPSSRELANSLKCARNLVLLAYEQLTLEGYLTPRGGAGTFVARDITARRHEDGKRFGRRPTPLRLSAMGRRAVESAARSRPVYRMDGASEADFAYGLCEPDERLLTAFRGALTRALQRAPLGYMSPAGDERLRQQIAMRLRTQRGIERPAAQILVTAGTQQALEICATLLLDEGDRVIVEETTYDGATMVFATAGARIIRVPVDAQGLMVDALPVAGPAPAMVYVTPSHQFPTGAVMSASRRYALLDWARRRGAYVFEDDYDGEFRYHGSAMEAVAAIDPDAPVIYSGTFSKALFPSLRMAYVSLPADLAHAAIASKWISDRGCPAILQHAVAELMASGAYDRHIRRMLRRNRLRRDALVSALHNHFGDVVEIEGADAGLHVVVRLRGLSARGAMRLAAKCRERGVGIAAEARGLAVDAEPVDDAGTSRTGLLLGYTRLPVERIEHGVRILADVYRGLARER
jgi:GntR family transcriptional regulator/MocR family aminotransferase